MLGHRKFLEANMRVLRKLILPAGLTILGGCDASEINGPSKVPTTSNAALVQRTNEQDVPWVDEEENPCTGDGVTINGTSHWTFGTTIDESGGFHLSSRVTSKGTGLGAPSGYQYTV